MVVSQAIKITPKTKKRLLKLKVHERESLDQCIARLLDKLEAHEQVKTQAKESWP